MCVNFYALDNVIVRQNKYQNNFKLNVLLCYIVQLNDTK